MHCRSLSDFKSMLLIAVIRVEASARAVEQGWGACRIGNSCKKEPRCHTVSHYAAQFHSARNVYTCGHNVNSALHIV